MEADHVFVDRHSGEFVAVEDLHAGLYLQQQTMIDVQADGVTFWHEVVLLEEVYPDGTRDSAAMPDFSDALPPEVDPLVDEEPPAQFVDPALL